MTDYRIIDIGTYPRKAHLEYFMSMNYPQFQITADVDVTDLKRFCRERGCSFFLSFLHVAALTADSIPQFRQRIHRLTEEELLLPEHAGCPTEGPLAGIEIREYAEGPTSHTESAGNEMYCYCVLYHHMPWDEYIAGATELQKEARDHGTLDEDPGIEGFYFPTCIPWIRYTEVVHPMTDRYDSNPRFSWGKYEEDFRGRLMMPLTVTAHHGLVDGLQAGKFYAGVEKNMAALIEGRLDHNILTDRSFK